MPRRREFPSTDFCAATEESGADDYAARRATWRRRTHCACNVCEASRGRQLRLIRAETDSGRSDGLLNTLTCRQPSAATSLPPHVVAVRVVRDAVETSRAPSLSRARNFALAHSRQFCNFTAHTRILNRCLICNTFPKIAAISAANFFPIAD